MLIGNIINHTFSITSQQKRKKKSELSNGSGRDLSGDKSRSGSASAGLGSAKPQWNFCG